MANNRVFRGELNALVEVFQYVDTKNAGGEAVKTPDSLGKKFVKRIDVGGDEEEDGRLIGLGVCRYIMRYTSEMLLNGVKYFIRDVDGDYEVTSVNILNTGRRKEFLEIKASRRG